MQHPLDINTIEHVPPDQKEQDIYFIFFTVPKRMEIGGRLQIRNSSQIHLSSLFPYGNSVVHNRGNTTRGVPDVPGPEKGLFSCLNPFSSPEVPQFLPGSFSPTVQGASLWSFDSTESLHQAARQPHSIPLAAGDSCSSVPGPIQFKNQSNRRYAGYYQMPPESQIFGQHS